MIRHLSFPFSVFVKAFPLYNEQKIKQRRKQCSTETETEKSVPHQSSIERAKDRGKDACLHGTGMGVGTGLI